MLQPSSGRAGRLIWGTAGWSAALWSLRNGGAGLLGSRFWAYEGENSN